MVSKASEIHEELERILESPQLRDSAALKALLRHVVEETLAGRREGLKEYSLGRVVFHRSTDYDPRTDAIVRVQASLLRKKLAAYYESAGRDASLQIDLPRGGYVPEFRQSEPAVAAPPPTVLPPPPANPAQPRSYRTLLGVLALGILATVVLLRSLPGRAPAAPEQHALWAGFTDPKQHVVVSVGVPLFYAIGDLYVRDVAVNRGDAPLSPRLKKIEDSLGGRLRTHEDVYTGVGEALGMARVSRWLEQRGLTVTTANSHYLGQSDLAGKNLVVISSMRFQTLLNQMQLPMPFEFQPEGRGAIVNHSPLPGEPSLYVPKNAGMDVQTVYAFLCVYPGGSTGTRILYLGGMHSWSTDGAAQYAIDAKQLRDLDRRLAADPARGPRGDKGPYVQVLLEVEGKHDQVRHVAYVSHRYLAFQ